MYSQITADHVAALTAMLDAERVSQRAADLNLHAHDQSFHHEQLPEVIVWPETTAEVSAIVRFANEARIPVTPWGAGTSLEGNPIAVQGGIMMDFMRMNHIIQICPEDFQVDVQPGVTRIELNKALARYGLFFAIDPGANATIGGMVANNSSGIKTIKYGATKDSVMQLEVVQANGNVIKVGSRARKDSSGYDLVHLFVGSEGTLGIVTEATLKLAPLPANFSAVLASFASLEQALRSAVDIMGAGLSPSALEFLDTETVQVLKKDKGLTMPDAPTLIVEFNGASDDEGLVEAQEICTENGAINFQAAAGLEARNKLWEARHHTYELILHQHPGMFKAIVDVCVPLSRYPEMMLYANDVLLEHNLLGYKFGHAGDGNLHINIMFDPASQEMKDRVDAVNSLIVYHAIELDGTATGEHGVGIGKRKYITKQHGPALDVMRQIKDLFDPNGILNPGKIFL